jgi:hypothetical protein
MGPPMTSRFICNGAPSLCASCGAPFLCDDGRLEAWRFGAHYFCMDCARRSGRHAPPPREARPTAEIMSLSTAIAIAGSIRIGPALRPAGLESSRR